LSYTNPVSNYHSGYFGVLAQGLSDPKRGRPIGGGGVARSWRYESKAHVFMIPYGIRKIQPTAQFLKRSGHEAAVFKKRSNAVLSF
jgi:hypothetical protein